MEDKMGNSKDTFESNYMPYINKWGKTTNWIGVLLAFGPALVLLAIFKIAPPFSAVIAAFIAIASALGINWVLEPISYFPIIGVPGTYMAFLTGNISNLRVPTSAVSQKVAGVEPGSQEGVIISTLGMSVSVIVNVCILTFGVVTGSAILAKVPPSVTKSLTYLLPSLFGALFMQFALMRMKVAPIALGLGLSLTLAFKKGLFGFLPGTPSYVVTLGSVFGTIAIAVALYKKSVSGTKKAEL